MTMKQISEDIPASDRNAFSQLSLESQQVLLAHYMRISNVMNWSAWENQDTVSIGETLNFWLTIEEIQSIEADINMMKPISNTPAYRKFLEAIFPDKKILFPYLADYEDANAIINQLSRLFWKSVRLSKEKEAIKSLKVNNIFAGYRNSSNDGLLQETDYAMVWLLDTSWGEKVPCVLYCLHADDVHVGTTNRRDGISVIPVFSIDSNSILGLLWLSNFRFLK